MKKNPIDIEKPQYVKHGLDYMLLLSVFIILSIGLIMVYSSTSSLTASTGDAFFYLKKQLIYILIGVVAMGIGINIDYFHLKKMGIPLLGLSFVLLILTYVPGLSRTVGGASRWLELGFLSFQPSEIAKLGIIFTFAYILERKGATIANFRKGLLPLLIILLFIVAPVLRQPDLGTSIAIVVISFIMFFVAGASIIQLLGLTLLGGMAGVLIVLMSSYQMQRIKAFINPWADPQGIGFHIVQSLLAIGSGGVFGLGLGASRQKFFYLPEQYTDFIFAVIAEELGFIGVVFVIALFMFFIFRAVRIARLAPDMYGLLLATGIMSWIGIQAAINICVVANILPTTGIPLPLISYGGTSLVILLYAIGVLLNISRWRTV